MFPKDKGNCSTCGIFKVPRSKHCSMCKKCVPRMDHHCVWLNNCIGQENYGAFMIFLFVQILSSAYGVYLSTGLLMERVKLQLYDRIHLETDLRKLMGIVFMSSENRYLLVSACVCGVVLVFIVLFFVSQCSYVLKNTTTNEIYKRSVHRQEYYDNLNDDRHLDTSWNGIFEDIGLEITLEDIDANPYDLGHWNNILDAMNMQISKRE